MTNVKAKISAVADKVANSKLYKGVEKVAVGASAVIGTVGLTVMNSFAAEGVSGGVDLGATLTSIGAADKIMANASPFVEPAIIIMCAVGGLRLGMKFLRGSAR